MSKRNSEFQKEIKRFPFEVKDMDDKGKFTGLLSTNGFVDPVDDRFNSGTWKRTISHRGTDPFPLFKNHNPNMQVGSFQGKDVEEGLFMDSRLNLETLSNGTAMVPLAYEQYSLYKNRDAKGLSVGFRLIEGQTKYPSENGKRIRDIFEAELIEGSMTPLPMNVQASVDSIKGWDDLLGVLIKNLKDKDLMYKIFSLYGYDPDVIATLDPVSSTSDPASTPTCDQDEFEKTFMKKWTDLGGTKCQ